MAEPEEIDSTIKAIELGVKSEIAAREALVKKAQAMKDEEKPKLDRRKWSKN